MSKKKYQEKLEALERGRQAQRKRWQENSNALREKISTYKGKDLDQELTREEMDHWVTKVTKIAPTQGIIADRKAGRTKGRYLKGKL